MARIAINTVIDIAAHVRVLEIRCIVVPVASRALKNREIAGVGVTRRTNCLGVAVGHGEIRVIERRSGPRRGGVAVLATRRESRRRMARIVRTLIIGYVAAVAIGWEARIVVVHVATGAGNRCVRAGKREGRVVVVEGGLGPDDGVVARIAGSRKTQLHMVYRRHGIVVVALMAGNTGRAGQGVVIIDVAGGAGHGCMRAG